MAAASGSEVITIPRSFKLLDELEDAEKARNVPPGHAGLVSLGLQDSNDMTLTYWNANLFGHNQLQDRCYGVQVTAPERYPVEPPKIRFVSKINMADVDQKTGEVSPKMIQSIWKKDLSIMFVLCHIRNNMKTASRLPQPPEGATY